MADNSNGRKKTVIISLLAFLLVGGGVFLFFIIQGANDLTGPKNKNFHYGSVARNSLAPFFKYLGVSGADDETLAKIGKAMHESRLKALGVNNSGIDMSGWMSAAPGGAPSGSGRGGASASARAPAVIPKMSGGRGGGGGISGDGQSNSSGASRFAGGTGSGNTKIAAASSGGAGTGSGRGTLGSLRGAQAMLSAGLRSGSAMTAKNTWDKSFGAGTTARGGAGSGALAYGSKGLTGLDTIKTGDISNLKTTDPQASNPPDASMPELVAEKDGKTDESSKTDVAKDLMSNALGGIGGNKDRLDPEYGDKKEPPPKEITELAEKPGAYCPQGCSTIIPGPVYLEVGRKDDNIVYKKEGDIWTAEIQGAYTLFGQEMEGTDYSIKYAVMPGENPPLKPLSCIPAALCDDI